MTVAEYGAYDGGIISHPTLLGVTTSHTLGSTPGMMPGMQVLETGPCHMGVDLGG